MLSSKIVSIKKLPKLVPVYDIVGVPKNHNFVGNNMLLHNCDESANFCIVGDTKIKCSDGEFNIKDLVGKKATIKTYNIKTKRIELKKYKEVIKTGRELVYILTTSDNNRIRCTANHRFLTPLGYIALRDLRAGDEIKLMNRTIKISCISHDCIEDVYDIIDVQDNSNFIANEFIVHNCTSAEWNKVENRELRKKLAQVRTRHYFLILCFPMKVAKLEKTYLDSFVNYWIHIMKRGVGAIFVKDLNPVTDAWRLSMFKDIGGFTEFTGLDKIKKKLKGHPNFWYIIRAPRPSEDFYKRYLVIREKNVYNAEGVLTNMSRQDIQKSILLKVLQDIMVRDSSLSMKRLLLHIKNEYGYDLKENELKVILDDVSQLIDKLKAEKYQLTTFKDETDWKKIEGKAEESVSDDD